MWEARKELEGPLKSANSSFQMLMCSINWVSSTLWGEVELYFLVYLVLYEGIFSSHLTSLQIECQWLGGSKNAQVYTLDHTPRWRLCWIKIILWFLGFYPSVNHPKMLRGNGFGWWGSECLLPSVYFTLFSALPVMSSASFMSEKYPHKLY